MDGIQRLHCLAKEGRNKALVLAAGKFYWIISSGEDDYEDEVVI